jgi:hypothetical protein
MMEGGEPALDATTAAMTPAAVLTGATCEVCGVAAVVERKCKVICLNCHTILKTCADL